MKTMLFTLAGTLCAGLIQAQVQGTITYKETIQMRIELDSATMAMLGDLPTENSVETELLFTQDASLYRNAPKKEQPKEMENNGGRRIVMRMDAPEDVVYCDLKNNRITEQREFMGKKFLVDTALVKPEWKLTGKQKMVINYPCQQAIKVERNDTTYAWFTPALQVSTGPIGLTGLPGLILEINADHGNLKVVATGADLNVSNEKTMAKPKEGKKVSPAQFRKIVDEKTAEMNQQRGGAGNGNVIIQIERH